MHSLYQELLMSAADISGTDALLASAQKFSQQIGFELFNISGIKDLPDGSVRNTSVQYLPKSYLDLYWDIARGRTDPVMQHCKHRHVPICWDQHFYVSAGMADRWEEMAPHGLVSGVMVALHLPRGRHLCVGFDRSSDAPRGTERDEVLTMLQLYTSSIIEPVLALLFQQQSEHPDFGLTPQEIECLKWAVEGKTAYETSVIVGLSQSRISKVLSSILSKLDCTNKQQALVKALRCGLV